MAKTECSNGHLYDTDLYGGVCPYCNGNDYSIRFDQGRSGNEEGRTVAPGNFGKTSAPGNFGRGAADDTGFPFSADNNQSGKTVAPEDYRRERARQEKTTDIFKKRYGLDPVVGWLVCVEGPNKGKDYHLWARINSIGRGESNDICIDGDGTISKEQHARLAYDSRHNSFQLIPGNSVNNIYLNDEPIYIPVKLNAYDIIELGESKMLFVPLCCERFQWEKDKQ